MLIFIFERHPGANQGPEKPLKSRSPASGFHRKDEQDICFCIVTPLVSPYDHHGPKSVLPYRLLKEKRLVKARDTGSRKGA